MLADIVVNRTQSGVVILLNDISLSRLSQQKCPLWTTSSEPLPAPFKGFFIEYKTEVMTVSNVVLVVTTTCTALMAGLFYAYSCSVVVSLKLLTDSEYIASMQSINKAIQNPLFFICFFGTPLLLPVSTYLTYSQYPRLRFWLLLTASIIYFIGVFGVTALGNIPLNDGLAKFNLANASKEAITLQRTIFEQRWNNLNTIRTISSILSLVLIVIADISSNKSQ